jgi:hypothetical protein
MPPKIDMVGERFGRLTVLKEYPYRIGGRVCWVCKCDCGAVKVVNGYCLRSGEVVSCRCYQRERAGDVAKGKPRSKKTVNKIIAALSGRKRVYVDDSHWLMSEPGVTLSEIAEQRGVSLSELREGVRKMRKKSYEAKVRKASPYGRRSRDL